MVYMCVCMCECVCMCKSLCVGGKEGFLFADRENKISKDMKNFARDLQIIPSLSLEKIILETKRFK